MLKSIILFFFGLVLFFSLSIKVNAGNIDSNHVYNSGYQVIDGSQKACDDTKFSASDYFNERILPGTDGSLDILKDYCSSIQTSCQLHIEKGGRPGLIDYEAICLRPLPAPASEISIITPSNGSSIEKNSDAQSVPEAIQGFNANSGKYRIQLLENSGTGTADIDVQLDTDSPDCPLTTLRGSDFISNSSCSSNSNPYSYSANLNLTKLIDDQALTLPTSFTINVAKPDNSEVRSNFSVVASNTSAPFIITAQPNPVTAGDTLNITLDPPATDGHNYQIQILNTVPAISNGLSGQECFRGTSTNCPLTLTITASSLKNYGNYQLQVTDLNTNETNITSIEIDAPNGQNSQCNTTTVGSLATCTTNANIQLYQSTQCLTNAVSGNWCVNQSTGQYDPNSTLCNKNNQFYCQTNLKPTQNQSSSKGVCTVVPSNPAPSKCSDLETLGYKTTDPAQKTCKTSDGKDGVQCPNATDQFCTDGSATKCAGVLSTTTGAQLCDPSGGTTGTGIKTAIGCIPTQPQQLVQGFVRVISFAAGGIALLLMIFGAIGVITSAGNPEKLKHSQEQFTSAIIGLLFIIFSVLLLQIIGVDILNIPGFGRS